MCEKLKEFFKKYFLDEKGNISIIAKIFCLVVVALIIVPIVFFSNKSNKNNDEIIIDKENIEAEIKDEILEVEENKELLDEVLLSILNTSKIDTATLDAQIKFLTTVEDTYSDLITISYVGNIQSLNKKTNLRGLFDLRIASFDISLEAPIFVNDIESDNYSIYIDVPSAYKPSFNMSQEQLYLYTNKTDLNIINEKYNLFDDSNNIEDLNEIPSFEDFEGNISYEKIDEISGIYSFYLNNSQVLDIFDKIEEEHENNILFNLFYKTLKSKENIATINSIKGQVAISNNVATDIYIEIEDVFKSTIACRFLFNNINDGNIFVNEFKNENVKVLSEFIENLNLLNVQSTSDQSNKTIEIKDVFFTGEDETKKQDYFTIENIGSCINVFINFTECTKQTNLVIKWFFEEQSIPIIETKISNGDYDEGMLKSSISFTDKENIQLGKYTLKIFIEGQENAICEQFFEILEKAPEEIIEEVVSEEVVEENKDKED